MKIKFIVSKEYKCVDPYAGVAAIKENLLANQNLALQMEERIKAEKALRETEKRFLTAQKMEAIGMLAGGIAHDFNNILQPLIGYSEMVFGDLPEHSPLKGHLEEIYKSALRARDLVK